MNALQTIRNWYTAYRFTTWLNDHVDVNMFQGWDVIRFKSGNVSGLMSGSRPIVFDVLFCWENRKAINDWTGKLHENQHSC